MKTEEMLHLFIIVGVVLPVGALGLGCTVTQTAGLTTYGVEEVSATDCHYMWCNGTKYVLANHAEEPKYPVVMKNSISLVSNECLENVYYKRDCISEESPYEAYCTVACSGSAGLLYNYKVKHRYWIPLAVALSWILVLFATLIGRCGRADSSL